MLTMLTKKKERSETGRCGVRGIAYSASFRAGKKHRRMRGSLESVSEFGARQGRFIERITGRQSCDADKRLL